MPVLGASLSLRRSPGKLSAPAAVAARAPLRTRSAPRRAAAPGPAVAAAAAAAAAGRWIRAVHQRTAAGKREGEKRKKDGREEKGAGVGGVCSSKARSPSDGRRQSQVSGPPPPRSYSAICLWSSLPPPPPLSPFNLRQPYRQLTHIVSILLTYSYSQGQDPGCCRSAPPIVLQQHARSPAAPISGVLSL